MPPHRSKSWLYHKLASEKKSNQTSPVRVTGSTVWFNCYHEWVFPSRRLLVHRLIVRHTIEVEFESVRINVIQWDVQLRGHVLNDAAESTGNEENLYVALVQAFYKLPATVEDQR